MRKKEERREWCKGTLKKSESRSREEEEEKKERESAHPRSIRRSKRRKTRREFPQKDSEEKKYKKDLGEEAGNTYQLTIPPLLLSFTHTFSFSLLSLGTTRKEADLSPWAVVPLLFSCSGSLSERLDLYFVDSGLVPLMISVRQEKKKGKITAAANKGKSRNRRKKGREE